MEDIPSHRYRLLQLGRPNQRGQQKNEPFGDFDDLVTHHPGLNRSARIVDGLPTGVESETNRSYALIGGEIQEVEAKRTDEYRAIADGRILLIKDFMLEDSRIPSGGRGVREVDVPSPIAGYIGRVHASQGLVDVYDRKDGEVVARVRHMEPIHVRVGDLVEYGQSLGVQNERGLKPGAGKHVHIEMDTRYYQQYENYIGDIASGRLDIDSARRSSGIQALAIVDDGVFRVGEKNHRIQELQEVLISEGYRAAHGAPLKADGAYRLEMQPAVLAYQRDHGLPQTGDIDRSTLHIALPHRRGQPIDRLDHVDRTRAPFEATPAHYEPIQMYRPGPDDHQRHPDRLRNDPRHPEHRDHAFYELLKRNLPPGTSDEMVAHVLLEAKIGKVNRADDVEQIMVHNDRVFVMGKTPGFRAAVDLTQTPPAI